MMETQVLKDRETKLAEALIDAKAKMGGTRGSIIIDHTTDTDGVSVYTEETKGTSLIRVLLTSILL